MNTMAWHSLIMYCLNAQAYDVVRFAISTVLQDMRRDGGNYAQWATQVWSALSDWRHYCPTSSVPNDIRKGEKELADAIVQASRVLAVPLGTKAETVKDVQQPPEIHRMAVWAADDWAAFAASLCHMQQAATKDPDYLGELIGILADLSDAASCVPIPMRVYIADMARGIADQIASQAKGLADECRWRASRSGEPQSEEPWTPDPDDLEDLEVDDDLPPQFYGDDIDDDWDDPEE